MSAKLKSYNKDHLPEGRYWDPSLETQEILSKLKPHNDKTESVFGVNDWLNRILPNMSQATRSVMIEFSANKTMEWLKNQAGELKVNLITLARKKRKQHEDQKKQDAKLLVERKMHQRAELVKRGKKKKEKGEALVQDLRKTPLFATVKELELRKRTLLSLSLPLSLKESELRVLIKRQIQLRKRFINKQLFLTNLKVVN